MEITITIGEIKPFIAYIGLWFLAQALYIPLTLKNFIDNKKDCISLLLLDLAALVLPIFAFIGLKLIGVL